MKKGIVEILQTEMLDFTAPVLINNLPSIDGLLCSQRQAIWGMKQAGMTSDKQFYKMLKASGRIFDYYVLGDAPLCGVMKNMGNNYVLNKYLMPKGSFGNKNLRDGTGSAPRYIECKLDKYSEYMLEGVNKKAVKMKKNYDATENEPILLPSKIPNILTNLRMSIAVSEANRMPSHNMNDVCDSLVYYLNTNDIEKAIELIKTPDLPSGGSIVYTKDVFQQIYKTGKGSFVNLGKYKYDKELNVITIYEIPYTTYIENIEDEIEKHIDKFSKELLDYHNGSDRKGLKLELYLKKNVNPNIVIQKLRKFTSYESKFSCNFTILDLDGKTPKLMSLQDIYNTWILHRINCIKNETMYDITKTKEELNRIRGLKIINQDLDKAIQIIRNSKTEKIAVKELINYFNLNQEQSEYISTIKLININQEWIFKKIKNLSDLENKSLQLSNYYESEQAMKETIVQQLEDVQKRFSKPRMTEIIYNDNLQEISKEDLVEDYSCSIIFTNHNYIKKNKRESDKQKLKDDDIILQTLKCNNKDDILLFTNQGNVLTRKVYEIDECLPSSYGTYLPNFLGQYLKENEEIIYIATTKDYSESLLVTFENGNIGRTKLIKYKTKTNRQVSQVGYNTDSKLMDIKVVSKDVNVFMMTTEGKGLIFNTNKVKAVKSNDTIGVVGINLGEEFEDNKVLSCIIDIDDSINFRIKTEKGKDKYYMLSDIAPTGKKDEERSLFKYISGKRNNQGSFIFNCRTTNDRVIKFNKEN